MTEQEQEEEQEHENKRIRPRERALGQKKFKLICLSFTNYLIKADGEFKSASIIRNFHFLHTQI